MNADIIDTMKQINRSLAALLIAMACLFTFPSFIHAQAEAPGQVESGSKDQMDPKEVFAPYPSRIRVGVRSNDILISWEDSPDVASGYTVYRHTDLPDSTNFSSAVLIGEVADDEGMLNHIPPDDQGYYYFILAKTPDGDVYEVFIPLRNVTLAPVATAIRTSIDLKPVPDYGTISGILTRNYGDSITVSFDAEGVPGRFVLYRGTAPIQDSVTLLDATVAAVIAPGSPPFRDYPVPGIEYYYAVIQEQALFGGSIQINPGRNATKDPVTVPAGSYRVGLPVLSPASRSIPLPYLVLTRGLQDARPVSIEEPAPVARKLSAETEKAIANLQDAVGVPVKTNRPAMTIFPEDLQAPGGGEEYTLRLIVSDFLVKGLYAQAAERFSLFLSLPRSTTNAAKARFYRGQALAMSGSFRDAFFDMLQAQDHFYMESAAWVDYILYEIRQR
ncbi:MAG: hypothetical protein A3J97_16060 [Spirochaetes bacterium RIFOXYC1_FULL_54_7]|nr:MAG: hypothetical protein A3J97_16060 [Spirochaetes bacterium RIFOXYC1_FULL_54_7]